MKDSTIFLLCFFGLILGIMLWGVYDYAFKDIWVVIQESPWSYYFMLGFLGFVAVVSLIAGLRDKRNGSRN